MKNEYTNQTASDEFSDRSDVDHDEKQIRRDLLNRLATSLLQKRDEAVAFRAASGVERRWREDEALFDGTDPGEPGGTSMMDYATGTAPARGKGPKRSKVVVNIIRGKCEIAEGRFSEIMFPTDDKNWGLDVTPDPMVQEAIRDKRPAAVKGTGQQIHKADGQPVTMSDVAKKDLDAIRKKMDGMENVIDDQLVECGYNSENRKVVRGAIRLGTGILKGPNVVKRVHKKWQNSGGGIFALDVIEEQSPASKEVSCWNVYPDPDCGEDIKKASYIWERDMIHPRELRDLVGVDGYFEDQIKKILREEPVRTRVGYNDKESRHRVLQSTAGVGNLFEKWEYYGDLHREDLEAMDVDLSHDDVTQSFSACVVFVNEKPIKVMLNVLDTGALPYDFFPWTMVAGSPWGIGVPRILFWLQRIITAAWRAMMDNAGDSAGANVVLSNRLVPVDGNWEITGKKIWRFLDNDDITEDDVRKAFAQFQITNNQSQLQAIIDIALKFVDMETAMPMLFQGEKAEAPETLGATNIMVDSSNVALRSRVKLFDDCITKPHLTRYYDWNMQYHDDPKIKGDFSVDARGTSVLYEKDQQARTLMQVMAMKQDPDFNLKVDWDKAVDQVLSSLRLDIAKNEEDLNEEKERRQKMASQGGPQDPSLMAAKIKSDTELKKAQLNQQADIEKLKLSAQEAELQRQHEMAIREMDQNIKMMELANTKGISLEKIKAELSRDALKLKTQVALAGPDRKGPQVATPPVEPEGRAPEGMAYQA